MARCTNTMVSGVGRTIVAQADWGLLYLYHMHVFGFALSPDDEARAVLRCAVRGSLSTYLPGYRVYLVEHVSRRSLPCPSSRRSEESGFDRSWFGTC